MRTVWALNLKMRGLTMDISSMHMASLMYQATWELSIAGSHELLVDGLKEKGLGNGKYFMAITGADGRMVLPVILNDK